MGPGAEFDLIRRFVEQQGELPPEVRVGPGDDAAVLDCPPGGQLVLTKDAMVEGVHFRFDWLDEEAVADEAAVGMAVRAAAIARRCTWWSHSAGTIAPPRASMTSSPGRRPSPAPTSATTPPATRTSMPATPPTSPSVISTPNRPARRRAGQLIPGVG